MEENKIEFKKIRLSCLAFNDGQIEGLPINPRKWTFEDMEKLKRSIEQTPELLDARGLIVVKHDGKYVILGGNMRFAAIDRLGMKSAPCYILPEDTPIEKLKEIVIKDNGSFGSWDNELLNTDWNDCELEDWGVKTFEFFEEEGVEDNPTEKGNMKAFSITFSVEEYEYVENALKVWSDDPGDALVKIINWKQ